MMVDARLMAFIDGRVYYKECTMPDLQVGDKISLRVGGYILDVKTKCYNMHDDFEGCIYGLDPEVRATPSNPLAEEHFRVFMAGRGDWSSTPW